jgi:hypothetical protein
MSGLIRAGSHVSSSPSTLLSNMIFKILQWNEVTDLFAIICISRHETSALSDYLTSGTFGTSTTTNQVLFKLSKFQYRPKNPTLFLITPSPPLLHSKSRQHLTPAWPTSDASRGVLEVQRLMLV